MCPPGGAGGGFQKRDALCLRVSVAAEAFPEPLWGILRSEAIFEVAVTMKLHETSIGGVGRGFVTTVWSDILAAGDASAPQHREALERLVRSYWKPVHVYLRMAWGKSIEDAKDLTQAFFAHLLERNRLSRFRRERGSFRSYLKQALRNFVVDDWRAEEARKPEQPMFRLEATREELERLEPASTVDTPEHAYDREWFRCLFRTSVEDLRSLLEGSGKRKYFEVFRAYLPDSVGASSMDVAKTPSYREIAKKLGISETDVRHYLAYCRRSMRELVRQRIREYVASEEEVDWEMELFFGG